MQIQSFFKFQKKIGQCKRNNYKSGGYIDEKCYFVSAIEWRDYYTILREGKGGNNKKEKGVCLSLLIHEE